MKLIADWGARSPGLDRLIAAECSHCDGPRGRLVRHDARSADPQGHDLSSSADNALWASGRPHVPRIR